MDGGNSLKSIDEEFRSGSARSDFRQVASSRFVPSVDVDLFKDDVKKSHAPRKTTEKQASETEVCMLTVVAMIQCTDMVLERANECGYAGYRTFS